MSKDPYNTADMKKVWEYTETEDGGICIRNYKGSSTDVFIPERIGKKPVEQILCFFFSSSSDIATIHIPKSVVSIKLSLARNKGFSGFVIDPENSVYTFEGNCLIENGDTVVWGNKDSVIPDDGRISKIEDDAFRGCEGLKSVRIPNSVTTIGSGAFQYCKDLTEVVLSENLVSVGSTAFYDSKQIHFNYYNGINYLGSDSNPYMILHSAATEDITSCEIHPKARFVMARAFSSCEMLESVAIPASVVSIGRAFPINDNLREIIIDPQNEHYAYSGQCLIENGDTVVWGRSDSVIPSTNGIKKIGEYAFVNCTELSHITIPEGVKEIEEGAFKFCTNLVRVDLPDGIERIGWNAFHGCQRLNTINLPDTISDIGNWAFQECRHLAVIKLPKALKKISGDTFCECVALKDITIPQNATIIEWNAFYGCKNLQTVIVSEGVQSIQYSAFGACTSLRSVTILNPETKIDKNAFPRNIFNKTVFSVPKGSIVEEFINQKKAANKPNSKPVRKPTYHEGEYIVRYRFMNMTGKWSVWQYCKEVFLSDDDALNYIWETIRLPDTCFEGEAEILDYNGKVVSGSGIA